MDILKNFMSGGSGDFGGGGASGSWEPSVGPVLDQTAAETARLLRSGTPSNQSAAETARLLRSGSQFTHDSENTVVSSKPSDNIKLNKAFLPNILDNYDAVTYHWKLFITTPAASSSGNIFDLGSQTIIAESGVTDLTIDNVEIRSLVTPSVECGTGTSTNVKFQVKEPGGASMIDRIFYQSLALGIGNWNVMPFYLQLQFRGRTPGTSEADDSAPGTISSLRWLWSLKISDIKVNVTNVGAVYDFTATIYDELAQSNAHYVLQFPVVLDNLKNFGDAMTKLTEKLNGDEIYRMLGTCSIPNSYKIIVDPDIAGFEITPGNSNTNSVRNNSTVSFEGKNCQLPAGTSVDKIIDALLANTDQFQTLINHSPTPGSPGVTMPEEKGQMKELWRIITETRPLAYDPRQKNFAKEFTIYVVKYDLGVLSANTFQDLAGEKTIDVERKRLMTYINKSILRKKYNYIFTGLNDQVVNFDIKINNAFVAAVNRMDGIYFNTAMADKGPVTHNHSADEGALLEKVRLAMSLQNNASTSTTTAAKTAMEEATTAVATANISDNEKKRITKLLSVSKPESRNNFLKDATKLGGIDVDGEFARVKLQSKSIATPVKEKTTDKNLSFISDIDIGGIAAKNAYTEYLKGIKGQLRPVARMDTMQQRQIGLGVESNSNSGLQKLSNMFAVALHSSMDVSFAQINLSIKGDPFWLFPPPILQGDERIYNSLKLSEREAITSITRGHFNRKDSVNILGTDNFIIVRFRTPRIFNTEETPEGDPTFSDVEMFSGVFKIVSITSRFNAGLFRQELNCLIDHNINVINFMKEIEGISAEQDKPSVTTDLLNRQQIPKTSVKLDKVIMGSAAEKVKGLVPVNFENISAINTLGPGIMNQAASNIPSAVPNIITGLPNIFG